MTKTPTFKDAFRRARSRGVKTFIWNGKKYTTKLKEETKKVPTPTRSPKKYKSGHPKTKKPAQTSNNRSYKPRARKHRDGRYIRQGR